jgi:hypothetical protein
VIDRDAYLRDGIVLARGLLAHEIDAIRALCEPLTKLETEATAPFAYHVAAKGSEGTVVGKVEAYREAFPELEQRLESPEVLAAVTELLGSEPVLFKEKIIFKPAGAPGFRTHQDANFGWWLFAETYVNVMVCIDRCDESNGAVEFAIGRHHERGLAEPWFQIDDSVAEEMRFERLDLEAGDVAFFDPYLPHRSAPNATSTARRVAYLTFNPVAEGDHRVRYFDLIPRIRRRFIIEELRAQFRTPSSELDSVRSGSTSLDPSTPTQDTLTENHP